MLALKRFSWFSIEFGLIEEAGETKVFGAGILSSTGEIPYSLFSPEVTRRPFVTDVVIDTDYDPSRMQDHLSSRRRCRSCGGSWKGWCAGLGLRC